MNKFWDTNYIEVLCFETKFYDTITGQNFSEINFKLNNPLIDIVDKNKVELLIQKLKSRDSNFIHDIFNPKIINSNVLLADDSNQYLL